jgi:hypothetical protein
MRLIRRLWPAIFAVILLAGVAAWTGVLPGPFSAKSVSSHGTFECSGALAPGTYQDVEVPSGDTCTIDGSASIMHDVRVDSNATLDDAGASIGHDLRAGNGSQITVSPSGGYTGTSATIGHDLDANGSGTVQVIATKVGNDVRVAKAQGSVSVTSNTVGHDLTVQDNAASTTVTGNTVGHDARCDRNASFTGGGNTAGGKETCN